MQGALNRDYTLVLGIVVFYGALIISFNFLVDLLYGWLDPAVAAMTERALPQTPRVMAPAAPRSLWSDAWSALRQNRAAMAAAIVLGIDRAARALRPLVERLALRQAQLGRDRCAASARSAATSSARTPWAETSTSAR